MAATNIFVDGRSFPVRTETPVDNITSALQPGTNTVLFLNSTSASDTGNITIYYMNSSLSRKSVTFPLQGTVNFNTTYNQSKLNVSDIAYVTGVYSHTAAVGIISIYADNNASLLWKIPVGSKYSSQSIYVCASEYGCSLNRVISSSDSVVRWACKVGTASEAVQYAWYTGTGITNDYFPAIHLNKGQRIQFYVTGYTALANASLYYTMN